MRALELKEKRMKQGGFTLVELVTVVAIIAILAMIAIPGYQSYVRKSHRGAAKAALVDAAQTLERYMTVNSTYVGSTVTPASTEGGRYALSFSAGPAATTYTAQAVPQGGQADDPCGTLSINQAGARTASGTDPSGPCW